MMNQNSISFLIAAGCILLAQGALSQEGASSSIQSGTENRNLAVGVNLSSSVVNTIDESVFSFGAFGDYFVSPNVSAGLSLDYWSDEFSSSVNRRAEMTNVIVGANGKFRFQDVAPGLRPFVLAGLAVHRFQVSTSQRDPAAGPADVLSENDKKLEDVEGELGADFGAGVNYNLQPAMNLLAEIRYRRILDRTLDLDQTNYSIALAYTL